MLRRVDKNKAQAPTLARIRCRRSRCNSRSRLDYRARHVSISTRPDPELAIGLVVQYYELLYSSAIKYVPGIELLRSITVKTS